MLPASFRLAIAQLKPIVGDVSGNLAKIRAARRQAATEGADLVLFSELMLAGYLPEDLVLKPAFQDACRRACETLARETADGGPALLIGLPWAEDGKVYNAVALLDEGRIVAVRFKADLPNYGVFDEKRVFSAGPMPGPMAFRGIRIGVPICEDIWGEEVVECLVETGAEILLVPNGSPYHRGKGDIRLNIAVARVTEAGLPLVYCNEVGGQDEVVFDGASFVLNADRSLAVQLPAFEEAVVTTTWRRGSNGWVCERGILAPEIDGDAADYQACLLGLRDYTLKNGFSGVVLGLSGGIDSALVAAMAVDALGAAKVQALMMPYRFTSSASFEDAAACAEALGLRCDVVPIETGVAGIEAPLAGLLAGHETGLALENLQSRVRGAILMSVSNACGLMVLTTGNKSEMSCGYCTLYGDMNGGFNPLKDLYKTEVYRLAALRNRWKPADVLGPDGPVIPARILTKAPSAELREGQTDQDSLPPYPVLDDILDCLVERDMRVAEVVARGHDAAVVTRVEELLYRAEYKRRQAAPGVKVTLKNFGRDRRYPITNRFRDSGLPAHQPDSTLSKARSGTSSADVVDF